MSETQTDYEARRPPDFASAPWRAERLEAGGEIDGSAAVWASDGDLVASVHPGIGGRRIERGIDRARLIAAVGTAAQEARELGYDPVAAVKALPELLFHAKQLLESLNQHGPYNPKREEGRASLQGALASAEGSENEQ